MVIWIINKNGTDWNALKTVTLSKPIIKREKKYELILLSIKYNIKGYTFEFNQNISTFSVVSVFFVIINTIINIIITSSYFVIIIIIIAL